MDENEPDKNKLEELMRKTKKVFENESETYKQRLVFKLLNAIKANDQREFFWIFSRCINAKIKDDENAKELSAELEPYRIPMSPSNFDKIAFTIIFGIMSS